MLLSKIGEHGRAAEAFQEAVLSADGCGLGHLLIALRGLSQSSHLHSPRATAHAAEAVRELAALATTQKPSNPEEDKCAMHLEAGTLLLQMDQHNAAREHLASAAASTLHLTRHAAVVGGAVVVMASDGASEGVGAALQKVVDSYRQGGACRWLSACWLSGLLGLSASLDCLA